MQTSPVLNTVAPAQAQAGKPATNPGTSPDASFNQVLSREMAGRNNSGDTSKTQETVAQKPAAPADDKRTPDGKKIGKDKTSDKDESADDATSSAEDSAAAATTDMLALVASVNQVNTTPASGKPVSADAAAVDHIQSKAKAGVDMASLARGQVAAKQDAGKAVGDAATTATPRTTAKPATEIPPDPGKVANSKPVDGKETIEAADTQPVDQHSATTKPAEDFSSKAKDAIAHAEVKSGPAAVETKDTAPAQPSVTLQQLTQPAVNNLANVVAAHAGNHLAPQVGTPGWDQALGQKITWMVAGEQQSASLTLNPPDLGPLQVVLNVTNSHADATFVAAQPEVRQALEAAMPRLRDMLSDAGIQLGQATVSSGSSGQQSGFDQQQFSSGTRRMEVTTTQIDAPMQTTGRVQSSVAGQGLVDTFV
ncbi:MAG TPA: flagellar hook-length control protein FliK [Noviherbaspirillum sp.]